MTDIYHSKELLTQIYWSGSNLQISSLCWAHRRSLARQQRRKCRQIEFGSRHGAQLCVSSASVFFNLCHSLPLPQSLIFILFTGTRADIPSFIKPARFACKKKQQLCSLSDSLLSSNINYDKTKQIWVRLHLIYGFCSLSQIRKINIIPQICTKLQHVLNECTYVDVKCE